MKKMKFRALPVLLCAAIVLTSGAALAATGGSKSDPLITLSYLKEKVIPDILDQFDEEIRDVNKDLQSDLADQIDEYEEEMEALLESGSVGSDTYELVTLTSGQTLALDVGCEVMLRVGSATVNAATAPALIDVSTGGTVNAGTSLTKNHLYMATISDRTLTPTADTVKLLVRGGYTVA